MIPLPDRALFTAGHSSRRGRVATAARIAPGTRRRTGTSPATNTVSTDNSGKKTVHSPQLPIRTSSAGADMQVRSPVAVCPASNSDRHPDPGEAASTAGTAADSDAASGTGGRLRGAPVRGTKNAAVRIHSPAYRMQVNSSGTVFSFRLNVSSP